MDAKGRVVLPREVRKVLGANTDSAIVFVKDKRRVYIRSVKGDVWQQQQTKAEDLEKK